MARTFLVGEPVAENAGLIAELDRLALQALTQAKESVRPGITGLELFERHLRPLRGGRLHDPQDRGRRRRA
jgi:Xaa-Pro aminopeptidase